MRFKSGPKALLAVLVFVLLVAVFIQAVSISPEILITFLWVSLGTWWPVAAFGLAFLLTKFILKRGKEKYERRTSRTVVALLLLFGVILFVGIYRWNADGHECGHFGDYGCPAFYSCVYYGVPDGGGICKFRPESRIILE